MAIPRFANGIASVAGHYAQVAAQCQVESGAMSVTINHGHKRT